ncbi:MAG: MFS transporter [Deltaproteobacteria bacterium]|nr:MFS transporter [Deltaproteobacteria bacterium]
MSLSRKLWIIALVYVIEGFPMGVYLDVWPVYFRRQGVSLTEIGWLAGLSALWSAKVLWSPLVDRYGDRQHWIVGALLAMTAALLTLVVLPSDRITPVLWAALALYCAASASQDIAIDAYTIGLVDPGEEGPTNSIRVGAYRVGLIAAGGGLLFLPRWIGWSGTWAVAAAISLAMAFSLRWTPRVPVPPESRHETRAALMRWLRRPAVWQVAAFVLLYRVGDRAMGPMVKPFWVDRGFSDEEIATISTTLGALATVLGALVGGGFVRRFGIGIGLAALGAFALASNLTYAAAAAWPEAGRTAVYAASIVESFCGGLATAAFLSYLMHICEKEHAAVQYALLTAIYALAGSLVAVPSGWLTERLDYAAYFALTALFALPAFAFLPGARRWIEE